MKSRYFTSFRLQKHALKCYHLHRIEVPLFIYFSRFFRSFTRSPFHPEQPILYILCVFRRLCDLCALIDCCQYCEQYCAGHPSRHTHRQQQLSRMVSNGNFSIYSDVDSHNKNSDVLSVFGVCMPTPRPIDALIDVGCEVQDFPERDTFSVH